MALYSQFRVEKAETVGRLRNPQVATAEWSAACIILKYQQDEYEQEIHK